MAQDLPRRTQPGRRLLIVVQEALFFTTHRQPIGQAMRARGWEVHVAAPADPALAARLAAEGYHFHAIPLARGGLNPLAELRLLWALWRLCRQVRPRLAHLVSIKPVIWGGIAARLAGVPAAVHAITGLGFLFIRQDAKAAMMRRLLEPLYRFALRHRNSIAIFQNPDDLDAFRARRLLSGPQVMIRGCGVDMQKFHDRPEPPVSAAAPAVVMFPARLLGDKGVREFAAAAMALTARGISARFVLVGRPDPDNPTDVGPAQLQQWIDSGALEYWGFAEDMPAMLARAHVIVLPSYREGLPRGLIEAAAIGRAIVTTDAPGCREVVRHEENGLLVPVADATATAAAIERLLADAALRRRLAARGREIAVSEFSVAQFVADSLAVYERLLTRQGEAL